MKDLMQFLYILFLDTIFKLNNSEIFEVLNVENDFALVSTK